MTACRLCAAMQDNWAGGIVADAPGPAFVTPAGGAPTSFSFTWVAPNNSAAERGHTLTLLWKRNSAAGTSTLLGGDMVITYHTNLCSGSVRHGHARRVRFIRGLR